MATDTFSLVYKIQGDPSGMRPANRELEKTDKLINRLGSGKGLSGLASSLSGVATGSQLNGLTSQLTSASGALSAIPGPAGLAVGAIALLGTVSVGAIAGLYGLAKSASDYGSEIFDASEKTGLSAETLSSFKLAADQSSSSLEQVTSGVTKFTKTIGEAALGSEEAAAKLKRLGIEPQKAIKDLDGALGDVFKRINALPPGVTQSKAAMDAFGKSGADLLPFIKSFNGDLPALIAKCKELGIVMTDKDARAADEFGDQMDTLTAQLKMVGVTFGRELMPVFLKGSKDISNWLSKNKGEIKTWGGVASSVLGEVAREIGFLAFVARKTKAEIDALLGDITIGGIPIGKIFQASQIPNTGVTIPDWVTNRKPKPPGPDSDYLDNLKGQKDAADKARQEREEIAKRESSANIAILKNQLENAKSLYTTTLDGLRKKFEETGDAADFLSNATDALTVYREETAEVLADITAAENRQAEQEKKIASEKEVLRQEQIQRQNALQLEMNKSVDENNKLVKDGAAKLSDEQIKTAKTRSDQLIALAESTAEAAIAQIELEVSVGNKTILEGLAERQTVETRSFQFRLTQLNLELEKVKGNAEEEKRVLNEIAILKKKLQASGFTQELERNNTVLSEGNSILAEINRKIEKGAKDAKDMADAFWDAYSAMAQGQADAEDDKLRRTVGSSTAVSAMGELHEMFVSDQNTAAIAGVEALTSAFDGLGQAVGAAVSAYVLYGSAGASVRQVTAQILAGIAQQAAVKAVFELAEGFAMLALAFFGHPTAGPSATQHFIASAVYGGIAGMAAVAGRAVAGDSFKKDQAGSSAGSSSGTGTGGSTQPATYTRTSPNAYMSGSDAPARMVADAVDRFIRHIESVPAEHVFQRGLDKSRGSVIKKVNQEAKTHPIEAQGIVRKAGIT